MAFEMVDGDQRLARCEREALAGRSATITPPIGPGPAVAAIASTSAIDIVGLGKHLVDQTGKNLDVGARGNLRDHAAIGLVRAVLPDHRLCKDTAVAGDERHRAVVAGRFKTKDDSHFVSGPLPEGAAMH